MKTETPLTGSLCVPKRRASALAQQAFHPLRIGMAVMALAAAQPAAADLTFTSETTGETTVVTFTGGSGTWTVPEGVNFVKLLVVAGGGGGGWADMAVGGGGAGGLKYYGSESPVLGTSYAVTPGASVSVSVGIGGSAGANPTIAGTGGDSGFDAVVAAGGGGGGNRWALGGTSGGSGGGASVGPWYSVAGGTASPTGQGHSGGAGVCPNGQQGCAGGGGGGAGTAGADATWYHGGNGGDGLSYSISGTAVYYAGGGGGDGRSAREGNESATDGTHGLGDIGGGGNYTQSGADGIVIVSYTITSNPTPTKLGISSVNGGVSPVAGATYSVTVQAQDDGGIPQNVTADTGVTLTMASGTPGSLGGTLTGTITSGTSSVTFSNLTNQVAENFTLQAAASSGPSLTAGTSSYIITPGTAVALAVTGFPSPQPAGTAGSVTVKAVDAYGNIDPTYTGTVTLSSSDSTATFAQNPYTFLVTDAGVKTLNATLNTVGTQSITANDGSFTNTQSGISVTTAPTVFSINTPGTTIWTCPAGVTAVELLVVGGGGGAGLGGNAAGGGAGGLRYISSYAVTPGNTYTVTVGAGGATKVSGGDTSFDSVTALGGGAGASFWGLGATAGAVGGSGGGSSVIPWDAQAGGAGTVGQGYAGGASVGGGQLQAAGGGGGGAGGPGSDAYQTGSNGNGGNGGPGLTYSISGSPVDYAGGGGGAFWGDPWNFANHVQGVGGLGSTGPGGGGTASIYWVGSSIASSSTPGQNGIVIVNTNVTSSSTPFGDWMSTFSGVPSGQTGFSDDPNQDGVTNGLAWILLGGTPMGNSLASLPVATSSAGALTLEFTCLKPDQLGTATFEVQYSNDLGVGDPWHSAAVPGSNVTVNNVVFTVIEYDATHNQVTAEIPQSAAAGGKLFGRVYATMP